jgi:hypothetical protein
MPQLAYFKEDISLIAVIDGSYEEEYAFHQRFAAYRFGLERE